MDKFQVPDDLKKMLSNQSVIPFVGAGISMSVKDAAGNSLFPSWKELLQKAADKIEGEERKDDVNYIKYAARSGRGTLEAAKVAKELLGTKKWNDFLVEKLDIEYSSCDPQSLRTAEKIWLLGSKLIVTTNYDKVLDWSCPPDTKNDLTRWIIEAAHGLASSLRERVKKPTVWHLHGRIDNVDKIILTPDGYEKLYQENISEVQYKSALSTLKNYLVSRTLLFIGFSFQDENLCSQLKIAKDIFQDNIDNHFVLIKESELHRIKELDIPLTAVPYKQHDDLNDLLEELCSYVQVEKDESFSETSPPLCESLPVKDVSASSKTLADLYRLALPSTEGQSCYEAIIAKQPELSTKNLFELGCKAIDFKDEIFFNSDSPSDFEYRHILISGPTGCGKTYLMESLILNSLFERAGTVLFIAPTRELVYEFHRKISETLNAINIEGVIAENAICSTGEVTDSDYMIHNGMFSVACIVNEKSNVLFSLSREGSEDILKNLRLVIIDELHMISDEHRGGVVDSLIGKLFEEISRRENDYEQLDLQIVGITTESMSDALKTCFTKHRDDDKDHIEPILINVRERPVAVEHDIAVLAPGSSGRYFLRKLIDFKSQSDRQIDTKPNAHFVREEILSSLRSNAFEWQEKSTKKEAILPALIQLCLDQTKKHRSTIVAVPSVQLLTEIAKSVANKRKNLLNSASLSGNELSDLENEMVTTGVATRTKDRVMDFAKSGVFLHYAGLPYELKKWIVNLFSKERDQKFSSLILFTTETLTYGVNLSADCVVLSDLTWVRSDTSNATYSEPKKIDIEQNSYHNILGRAGRAGVNKIHDNSTAIVCVAAKEFHREPQRKSILDQYYYTLGWLNKRNVPPLSRLIDKHALKICSDKSRNISIEDFSFPTFRSIMDGLRHVGNNNTPVTVEKLIDFFSKTIYWQTNSEKHDQLKLVVTRFLEAASKHSVQSSRLKLIVCHEPYGNRPATYQIQPQGEALIDTGTKLQSIEPLAAWLSMIRDKAHLLQIDGEVPVELLIPGFVASPDFWAIAKELVVEGGSRYSQPTPEALHRAKKWAVYLLEKELYELNFTQENITEFIKLIEDYSKVWLGGLSLSVADCKETVFIKLTTISLMWVRGATLDEIARTYNEKGRNSHKAPEFQTKYSDRLGWMAVMAHRFFRGEHESGYLLREHERDLPQQSLRLRLGLPVQGLPFLGTFPVGAVISRHQIRLLLDKKIRPSDMLWFKNDNLSLHKIVPSISGIESDKHKIEVVRSVRKYFSNQIKEFGFNVFSFMGEDINNKWKNYSSSLLELTSNPNMQVDVQQEKFSKTTKELIISILSSNEEKNEDQGDHFKITISRSGKSTIDVSSNKKEFFSFHFLKIGEESIIGKKDSHVIKVVALWPWPERSLSSGRCFYVTGFGAIVIAVLLARNFIEASDIINILSSELSYSNRIISIKRLLSELTFNDIDRTPIRENLLSFFEPGGYE